MIIGLPKEAKVEEYRVAITPMGVATLTQHGHRVLVQATAGEGSGFADKEYIAAGATVVSSAEDVFSEADMVYKVKEPLPDEYPHLKRGQLLFSFLHLAADEKLTHALMDRGVSAIAYETVELPDGSLPLLIPMSQIAGRLATQIAAHYLEKPNQGAGKLLGGVPGVPPSTVVILGGGTVGTNAARIALGMGARVIIADMDVNRLRYLNEVMPDGLETMLSNPYNIANAVKEADAVIGAVLATGARAPIMVTGDMIKSMKPGSVIVDVSVDQGGCAETTHPTSHSQPTYVVDGVIHYCVNNMPGIVPQSSTQALCNTTLPYTLKLADLGLVSAIESDKALARGVNIYEGLLTNLAVSQSLGIPYTSLDEAISKAGGLMV